MLALRIALRYLAAPKSHRAVNVISAIAVAGVAVATAAIVVVLSVFNGFSELSRRHLSFVDPDLSISAATGKTVDASAVARVLDARNDVAAHTPVLVERGLMVTANGQMPVVAVGIDDDSYRRVAAADSIVLDGIFTTGELMPDMPPAAVASVGVAMQTGIRPSPESTFDIYFPRRRGRINPANPSGAYVNGALTLAGVFRVDQPEYDTDRLYIPLAVMRTLLERDSSAATTVDVRLHSGADVAATADEVSKALGSDYVVTERERLHPETFRMIAVEKWITFLMLVFILLIASFNIVTTISLLVIEKRDNMGHPARPRHTAPHHRSRLCLGRRPYHYRRRHGRSGRRRAAGMASAAFRPYKARRRPFAAHHIRISRENRNRRCGSHRCGCSAVRHRHRPDIQALHT